jgi:hypothetical protein
MFTLKSLLSLLFVGSLGAIASKQINQGNFPWWSSIFISLISGLVWGWMASQRVSLIYASTLYDATMAIVYVITFICLGENVSLIQFWGIVLSIVGIILINQ